jgi:CheY-like chemotaxis protein
MIAKRALIVDDSRSARVILSRMLEAYGLEVDAAESAEQALEYLRQGRPDVIFMDHLMPGMDGFQAVQAIKGNPDTAMIPVMMYTSQEGDLYVSQARALGAVGVLPKTVKQGEVSRVLYQLRLLPERREGRAGPAAANQEAIEPVAHRVQIERAPAALVGEIETAVRQAIAPALKELNSELRRFMLAGFEAFAKRLTAEIKGTAASTQVVQQDTVEIPAPPEPTVVRWPVLAGVCAVALLPTLVLGALYVRTLGSTNGLLKSNAHLTSVIDEQQAQLRAMQDALRSAANRAPVGAASVVAPQSPATETVPYGEAPLSGARLERLRSLIDDLTAAGFRGTIKVSAYVGEFCLTGNGIEGYSIAADDLPIKRCDLVGNPFDDSLPNAQRQSLQFANLLAGVRQQLANALTIEVDYAGRRPSVAYPEGEQLAKTTAGEWNRIAARNNRVEFVMEAAPSLADTSG